MIRPLRLGASLLMVSAGLRRREYPPVPAEDLRARAAAYLSVFVGTFANVVAEEDRRESNS